MVGRKRKVEVLRVPLDDPNLKWIKTEVFGDVVKEPKGKEEQEEKTEKEEEREEDVLEEGSEAVSPLAVLPVEMIQHILSLLPYRSVEALQGIQTMALKQILVQSMKYSLTK